MRPCELNDPMTNLMTHLINKKLLISLTRVSVSHEKRFGVIKSLLASLAQTPPDWLIQSRVLCRNQTEVIDQVSINIGIRRDARSLAKKFPSPAYELTQIWL